MFEFSVNIIKFKYFKIIWIKLTLIIMIYLVETLANFFFVFIILLINKVLKHRIIFILKWCMCALTLS